VVTVETMVRKTMVTKTMVTETMVIGGYVNRGGWDDPQRFEKD
jgi:hypothetical protein